MFEVRVNGKAVYQEEAQVIGVSFQSARGELYKAGISNEGVIDVRLDTVNAGDPIRLDQLEAAQARARAAIVEGQATGNPPLPNDHSMAQRQDVQDDTLRPGGPSSEIAMQGSTAPPSVDLASGLDPRDSDTLTARLEAFGRTGDAEKAIADNPPGAARPMTAEQGAVPGQDQGVGQPTDEQQAQAAEQADKNEEQTLAQAPGVGMPAEAFGASFNPLNTPLGASQTPSGGDVPPTETTPEGNSGSQPQGGSGFNLGMSEGADGGSGPEGPTTPVEGIQTFGAPGSQTQQ